MRKPDLEVREVLCSETGKPMPKIPLWMADIKVKFISDEARQKHPAMAGMADVEPLRRSAARGNDNPLKAVDTYGAAAEEADPDTDFDEPEAEEDDVDDDV